MAGVIQKIDYAAVYGFFGRLVRTREIGLRDFCILSLMETGCLTRTQVTAVNMGDVERGGGSLQIRLAEQEAPVVPEPISAGLLEDYLDTYRQGADPADPLFIVTGRSRGDRLELKGVSVLHTKYFGSKRCTPEEFRTAAVTAALAYAPSQEMLDRLFAILDGEAQR